MGRLGFNIGREKEASKNVEAGVVAADQQNAKNEYVEIGELVLAIEEGNRRTTKWRRLSGVLSAVIILLSAYIFLAQSRVFCNDQAATVEAQDLLWYSSQMQALKGENDELRTQNQEKVRNCSAEESERIRHLEEMIDTQRAMYFSSRFKFHGRLEAMSSNFEALEKKHKDLEKQYQESQEELKAELRKLGDERAELERKLTEANRTLERQTRQPKASPTLAPPPTTTTTTTTTMKAKPKTTEAPGYIKKLNNLVKDIESGAAIFNFQEFMKKTEDVFRF
ncbi:uncharacterized protein LOC106642009 [Copidosoma floridanum]|uniref:uncharacterized protein LOC106642009 n=1 Tax=Copidosoma floridanum TaxID=29053 RepID=UPI0006C94C96|nr:uncharacterized protein LOC106642009 [Copidosoma floridanum]